MAINKQKLTDVSPGNIYDKLQEGVVFAGVTKKDGSVSYRGLSTVPEYLETLFKSRVTNEDKGKARKAHWSDGMTTEQKKAEYVEGRKPIFIYDALRSGYKGASIYLENIVTDTNIGDLENLVFISKEDLASEPSFKLLQEGKLDVRDFLASKSENVREDVSWEKKKEFLEKLEKDVYVGTFRKRNGEPRVMVMTRNEHIIDEYSGDKAYETAFKLEEDSDEYLEILNTGIFPVYDIEKGEPRVFSLNQSVEVGKYPRLKKLDISQVHLFAVGEISLDELVFGTARQRRANKKNEELKPVLQRADIITAMGATSTWNDLWQHRMTKLIYMFEKELPKEFKEEGADLRTLGFVYKSHLNNKVVEVKLGKGEGEVYLIISPKGIYDVKLHKFEYKTNPGRGKDSALGGLNEQQERMYLQRKVLGMHKALLVNYILKTMDRRKKANTIKYFEDKFIK